MQTSHGFSLVEIAVVLFIIGLVIGGFLVPISMQLDINKIKTTQERLEKINEALIGFAILNGHLPCPSLDYKYGKAADFKSPGKDTCTTYDQSDGYLPWADLGTVGAEKYDGWGNPFRYRVDGKFSNKETGEPSIADPPKNEHALEIRNRNGSLLSSFNPDLPTNEGSYVVAIIFSCGKNGRPDDNNVTSYPSYSDAACEVAFTPLTPTSPPPPPPPSNTIYVQDIYVENTFDDILVWLPKNILINRLVMAEKWPP